MSSETSTSAASIPTVKRPGQGADGLRPWQFFVLAALGCATAATFLARGQGYLPILLLSVLMAATALVGLVGHQRTRAALEREKMLALRA